MYRRQRLRPMRGAPRNLGHRSVQEQSDPVHSVHIVVSASSSSSDSSRRSPSSSKRARRSTSASSDDSMSSGELVLDNLSNEVNSMQEKNVVRLDKLLRKIQDSSSRPSTSSTICRSCKRARHSKDSSSRPLTFYEAADAALPPKGKGKSPAIEVEDSEFGNPQNIPVSHISQPNTPPPLYPITLTHVWSTLQALVRQIDTLSGVVRALHEDYKYENEERAEKESNRKDGGEQGKTPSS